MPRPGAANGVVPKNGMGIAFWIAGRSGQRGHRERRRAERDGGRHQAIRNVRRAEQRLRHRREHEEGDEQAHAAVGDERAREHDRQHRALGTEALRHEARDRRDRAAVVHQLAEHGAQQEQREELQDESGRRAHERDRPVREQRLARRGGGDQCRGGREHEHAPAAKRQPDESAPSPSRMPSSPMPSQIPSSIASRSSVERTPRSAPCASRKAAAALRPSSRSMQKNGHSVRSLDE